MNKNQIILQLITSCWSADQDPDAAKRDADDAWAWASSVYEHVDTRHSVGFVSPFGMVEILGPAPAVDYFKKLMEPRDDSKSEPEPNP